MALLKVGGPRRGQIDLTLDEIRRKVLAITTTKWLNIAVMTHEKYALAKPLLLSAFSTFNHFVVDPPLWQPLGCTQRNLYLFPLGTLVLIYATPQ